MAASYPSSAKTFAPIVDGVDYPQATHVNSVYDEIAAIEAALLTTGLAHSLKFVDATHDIGASGAFRPRDLFLSRNATIGGTLGVTGVATFTAQAAFSGGATFAGHLIATDATYDIGASGATRFRDLFLSRNAVLGGTCYIGDTANANMTRGLTINQGAADDQLFAGKSSDVDHGMTSIAETDTYVRLMKASATDGGAQVTGFGEGVSGIVLQAYVGSVSTAHNTGANAAFYLGTGLKSGSDIGNMGADANLFAIDNGTNVKFLVDNEGDTFQDGTAGTYSDYDDAMLALAMEHHLNPKEHLDALFRQYCQYNKRSLVDAGLLGEDGPRGERGLVNMSGMTRLAIGAAWQNGLAIRRMARALVAAGVVTPAQLEAA